MEDSIHGGSTLWVGYVDTTLYNGGCAVNLGSGGATHLSNNINFMNNAGIIVGPPDSHGGLENYLYFKQGSASGLNAGGITTAGTGAIANYGNIVRDSPTNPAVYCIMGIQNSGSLLVTNWSKLEALGNTFGNSIYNTGITTLSGSAQLTVQNGFYQAGAGPSLNIGPSTTAFPTRITGNVQILTGELLLDWGDNPNDHSIGILEVTGNVTIGGHADINVNVYGEDGYRQCDGLQASGTISINAGSGDQATLSVGNSDQAPPQNTVYSIMLAEHGITGRAFAAIYAFGFEQNWQPSPIPGSNPFTITAK